MTISKGQIALGLLLFSFRSAYGITGTPYVSDLSMTSSTNGWGPVEINMSNGEKSAGDGNPIRIRGAAYSKGLGVHASSTVRYNIGGSCSVFASDIGVDDEVASQGSVTFQVWGDGVKLYDSGLLTGASAVKSISVNVSAKTLLDLIVTDGGDGASNDHADWANARLTCQAATTVTSFVSDLTPQAAINGWGPAEKDMSNGEKAAGDGKTLTLNGVKYSKGLGVHAASDLKYNLGKVCTTFGSDIGVDDEVGSYGSVIFQVWADGTNLYDSGVMTGSSATKTTSVDVTGKGVLDLIVTDGGDGASNDHADWANAKLTCASSTPSTPPAPTPAPAVNQAPVASSGAAQTITLPAAATLNGSAKDDGLPSGTLTVAWSKVSGPGTVVFSSPATAVTNASFSTAGAYTLRLTASDGVLSTTSDTTVVANSSTIPPGAVVVNPGDDVQNIVGSKATGTTFYFNAGVYRTQSINPRDGDVFIGASGAILNGANLLTAFSRQGSYWVAANQNQQGTRTGSCLPQYPRCTYPEDFFIDGVPLQHVGDLASVGAGKYYFDYTQRAIYFADDPTGHTVEASVAPAAFYGSSINVTIQGFIIEKYANPAQSGAIHGMALGAGPRSTGWIIKQNEVRQNHGGGIWIGEQMQILNNFVHDNGQMGVIGGGSSVLVQDNEIAYNNRSGYDPSWEAGGTKFVGTTNLVVRRNYVHHNIGPGLWTDSNNSGTLYENNHTVSNQIAGIMHEISFSAIIRNNLVENDAFTPTGSGIWYGSGILVSASSGVEVYGNTVTNCMAGIGGMQGDRGSQYLLQNLYVHDNTITQSSGTAAGIVKSPVFDDSIFATWSNRFQNNTYVLSNSTGNYYTWKNADVNKSTWIGYGNDVGGSWK